MQAVLGKNGRADGFGARDRVTPALEASFHKTVKKVTSDIEEMKFNTAIAAMMSLINEIYDVGTLTVGEMKTFASLLCPFAPHISEEIWEQCGGDGLLSLGRWPTYDEAKTVEDTIEIAVQICGKLRSTIQIPRDADQATALAAARADGKVQAALEGKTIVKEIYVPGRIVNIVAK